MKLEFKHKIVNHQTYTFKLFDVVTYFKLILFLQFLAYMYDY